MSWGEREEAFIPCLARGSGRLISSHRWDLTVQYRKARGESSWEKLGLEVKGGSLSVCAAAPSGQQAMLDAGERWLGSTSAGRQANQSAERLGGVSSLFQLVAERYSE